VDPQKPLKLGDILLQANLLNAEQLEKAAKMARQLNVRLGDAIVKQGFATEEQIAMCVSKLLGVPYASKENKILRPERDQELDKVIEEKFARENFVLPLFLDEGVLAVSMSEPENVMVLENIKLITGFEIQPFISTRTQIIKAIDEFYGSIGSMIDKAIEKSEAAGDDASVIEEVDVSGDRLDLDKMVAEARGAQVVQVVNAILKQAISEKCSDIHIERYDERVMLRFRIHGTLYEKTPPSLESFAAIISRIKILTKLDIAERRLPQDGAFSLKVQNRVIDLRVSICPTVFGEKVVMRILDKGSVELKIDNLGLEPRQKEDFLKAADAPHGLIFLTGPTGSGKTTTLYTVLNTIKTPELNFMTIEDPVEFKLEGINQVQVRAAIGLTFAGALRSFLLVLSTLHTNSAIEAVVRLTDMGVEAFMLASSVRMLAAQRLVRTLCPTCKIAYRPDKDELNSCLNQCMLNPKPDASQLVFYKAKGCPNCHNTGYNGRKAVYEIYYITGKLRTAIYKHSDDIEAMKKIAEEEGMWDMRASAWRKVMEGITSVAEVESVTISD